MQECTKRNVSTETKCRFHVFQDERFVDLNLYQYGWEQTEPLHSYGPYARNHYLFHYVISGKGLLLANEQEYTIEGGHGFLIAPGQVTTYRADEQEPWEYTWIEFDGLRAHEALNLAGISGQNPVYSPASTKAGQLLQEQMLFLVNHSQDSPMRQIGYGFLFLDQLVQSSASHQAQSPRRLRDFYIEGGAVLHRAALQRRYFHRGYLLLLRTEPQLFQQGVSGYHGRKPAGVPAALPHGTGGTAADRKPPAHQHHQHHGQLSQSASLFPCVQKCIWHQPTGLSCKAFCTIKIGLILRYTPFVFPTYKNTPFVRPNTVGQMGRCSFRGAPCFFTFNPLIHGSRPQFRIAQRVIVDEIIQL